MATSGQYRSEVIMHKDCDCGSEGDVEVFRDREDNSQEWDCPICGVTHTEEYENTSSEEDQYMRGYDFS